MNRDYLEHTMQFSKGIVLALALFSLCFLSLQARAQNVDDKAEDKAAAAPVSATVTAPVKAADTSVNNRYLLQLFSGLLIVVLSIVALAWLAKRFSHLQAAGGGRLKVIEAVSMGSREKIVIVEADGERLLLGVAPGRINFLQSLSAASPADSTGQRDDGAAATGRDAVSGKRDEEDFSMTFSQKMAAAVIRART